MKISRRHLAGRFAVGEQINSDSVVGAEERILLSVRKNVRWTESFGGQLDPNGPSFFSGPL